MRPVQGTADEGPPQYRRTMSTGDDAAAWRDQRREAAAARAEAAQQRRDAETAQARRQISEFLEQARSRGLEPVPLVARAYSGGARYRTALRGWYLKRDLSVAVGTDGEYYPLAVPASLRARFTGAHVEPTDAPLVVGAGGRDGESIPLQILLTRRLEQADAWPLEE